jgi:hypothetical protein
MPFSEELHDRRVMFGARLREATVRLWSSPDIRRLYAGVLFNIHGMARASVPLMQTAIDCLECRSPDDPLIEPLIAYFEAQIPLETGHDDWLLDDLEALGEARGSVLARMPSPTVAALVGAQYYWMRHHHPVALLGYILVVESDTPTQAVIDRTIAETGLPRSAFRSFSRHAVLEAEHNETLDRLLDSLPLTEEQRGLIGVSVIQTLNMIASATELLIDAPRDGALADRAELADSLQM